VHIPAGAAGAMAVRMLVAQIQGDSGAPRRCELQGELIVRGSTGPVAAPAVPPAAAAP
jgi:DNA-binding LacI/PurR family transcriptional regulator